MLHMTKVIYVDVLFLVNFIINYLILFASGKIQAVVIRRWRLLIGGFIGAIYGVATFFPDMEFLSALFSKLATSSLMVLISFGWELFLKKLLVFLLTSLAFGGVIFASMLLGAGGLVETRSGIYYFHISAPVLIFVSVISYILFSLIFNRSASRADRKISRVTVLSNGASINANALHDTGNSLRDPGTNAPVLISDYSVLRNAFPPMVREILDSETPETFPLVLDKISPYGKFKLIPYKTVGVPFALMLAYKPDKILVDGKEKHGALIALSRDKVSDGGAYTALI